jgi:hypothetical protein
MAIEKNTTLVAAASIVMGAAGAVNFQSGCVIARASAGTYTITCDTATAASNAVPTATQITAAAVAFGTVVTQTSATVWTVTTSATVGGAAADVVGTLVFKLELIGVPGLNA